MDADLKEDALAVGVMASSAAAVAAVAATRNRTTSLPVEITNTAPIHKEASDGLMLHPETIAY